MRTVVAVLRGGPSKEYDVSLKTGANVLAALDKDKYEARDIFISRNGEWHLHGVAMHPERALRGSDVAFNAMHGDFGEDGSVQRILDSLAVPYTGSGAHPSAVAFNKHRTREAVTALGIKVPHGVVIDADKITDLAATALNLFRSFPHPAIVKPVAGSSSLGTAVAENFNSLLWALEQAFKHSPNVLIEEFIKGREATVGVVDNFRNERSYTLMPTEVLLPTGSQFYDFEAKYGGQTRLATPAHFTDNVKAQLQNAARAVHEGLGLRHHSRSDFRVSPRGVYFLEVETSVDLADDSEFVHMLNAGGTSLPQFLDHVLQLARKQI